MRFLFPIFKIRDIAALGSQKGCERSRRRDGHGLRDGSCEAGAVNPRDEALRRCVFARPRAPAPAAEGRFAEKSASPFGFARKPSKSPDSRKKEAWIFLPLALEILPRTLSNTRLSRETAPLPLAFIELRASGEAPLPRGAGESQMSMGDCANDKNRLLRGFLIGEALDGNVDCHFARGSRSA